MGDIPLNRLNATRINASDVPDLFYPNASASYYVPPGDRERLLAAAQLAVARERPLVRTPRADSINLSRNTTREILDAYVQAVEADGRELNHIVVGRLGSAASLYGPVIATRRQGLFVPVDVPAPEYTGSDAAEINARNGVARVEDAIRNASRLLHRHGMLLESDAYLLDGAYISLIGVPHVVRDDPVDANTLFDDPADGKIFYTDWPYGDLDGDGKIDAAVGRYPDDLVLASELFLRGEFYDDNKRALVASEYLHANWPTILAYIGGGMWSGKSMEHLLERRGYDVTRLIEHRADPASFLVDITPANMQAVFDDQRDLGDKVGAVLGGSIGSAVSTVLVYVKAVHYVERGLEQYLEHDWSTVGFDPDRAASRLNDGDLDITDPGFLQNVTRDASAAYRGEHGFRDGIVQVLQDEGVQQAIGEAVWAFLWPDRYERISEDALVRELPAHSIVYYEGVGNGSAWHLPNNVSHHTFLKLVKKGRYNGSNSLMADDLPRTTARIVFDNSDLAGRHNASRDQLWRAFLDNGAASFIGVSSVNYAPYSSEIDTRFFRDGYTTGMSMLHAINDFSEDWLTWDPFNAVARGGAVKQKMLRSFVLYGDPTMWKDPVIAAAPYTADTTCEDGTCTLTVDIDLNYSIETAGANRSIVVDANGKLLRDFRPIIPLISGGRLLPRGANASYTVTHGATHISNITVPVVEPLSHGQLDINTSNLSTSHAWYPANATRVAVGDTIDNRTRVRFIQAAYRYNRSSREALVYTDTTITVTYRAPVEFSVDAADTVAGDGTGITASFTNPDGAPVEGRLLLRIGNGTSTTSQERPVAFSTSSAAEIVPFTPPTPGAYEVQAFLRMDNTTIGPRTAIFSAANRTALLYGTSVNEVLPDPAGTDTDNEYIELYNPGAFPVDLSTVTIADAASDTALHGTIPPRGFRIVNATRRGIHLNNGGDTVTLTTCRDTAVDAVTYPGGLDEGEAYTHTAPGLHIAAVTPDAVGSDDNESLVLRNPAAANVSLGAYRLVDADGHEDGLSGAIAANTSRRLYPSVSLNNGGDTIALLRRACTTIDTLAYTDTEEGVAIGRYPDGATNLVAMDPTPNASNRYDAPGTGAVQRLVINELLPAPRDSDGEFVELHNPTGEEVPLDGLVLVDAAGNERALAGTVDPYGYHVTRDVPALNNDGDTVTLRADGTVIDTASYDAAGDDRGIGRSPDATGSFTDLPPTPGAQNPVIVERVVGGGRSSATATVAAGEGGNGTGTDQRFIDVSLPDTVYAGVPFTVEAVVNASDAHDRIYSYAYNGSAPVTEDLNGSGAWTANAQGLSAGVQTVALEQVVEDGAVGTHDFTITLAGDEPVRLRDTITVSDPPALHAVVQEANDSVTFSVNSDCGRCTVTVTTPAGTDRHTVLPQTVSYPRAPGAYVAELRYGDHVIDTVRRTVDPVVQQVSGEEDDEEAVEEQRADDRARTPTGAVAAEDAGALAGIASVVDALLDLLVFW